MKCKFCSQEKKLIEAHIIPHSFFKPILNESKPGIFPSNPENYKKKAPKGIYDSNLVCEDCEKLFSPYDDYAKRLLLDELKSKIVEPPHLSGRVVIIPSGAIDYTKLKLFFISLIWRASASDNEFYKKVNVGPFEERLKEMIKTGNPGSPEEFPIIFKIFSGPGADKQMMSSTKVKIEGRNYYRFYLAGICAQIKVDSRPLPLGVAEFILAPDGPMVLMRENILESNELKQFFQKRTKKSVNKFRS